MLLPSYSTGKVCKDEPSASPCVEVKAMNFTRLIATFSIHSGSRGIISSPTRVNSCCMLSGGTAVLTTFADVNLHKRNATSGWCVWHYKKYTF
mmetsp:Transcript_23711/g.49236  ORF Transcript_23711/g.49236 Transcript_23711/m.49236 type:complete len:93 (-) Transcript_23711:416-694(-)